MRYYKQILTFVKLSMEIQNIKKKFNKYCNLPELKGFK